jgi:SAM-dependent methyltransferase
MAQMTDGVRAILSLPLIYSSFQFLMSPRSVRRNFVADFIKPFPGISILDIGCGPADILDFLPAVDYWGFDISEPYIQHAQKRFNTRGKFISKQLEISDLASLPKFDVALALGLIHHLDNIEASNVMRLARATLKPGGRLITIDPVLDSGQNRIARFLILKDRGQNVRERVGYEALAREFFDSVRAEVRHQTFIPYTHCMMECTIAG